MARRRESLWKEYLDSLKVAYIFALIFSFVAPIPWAFRLFSALISGFVFGTMFFAIGVTTSRIRIPSFLLQCIFRSLLTCAVLAVGMLIVIETSIAMFAGRYPWDAKVIEVFRNVARPQLVLNGVALGFALSLGINAYYQVRQKIGPGVLMNWVTGKYYLPREEERIFMFLDLKNSTTLAEKLGNLKFSKLCQEFFRDLSYPVGQTKGEVSHYIGDEAVLTWKPKTGLDKANCLQAFFFMDEAIRSRTEFYLAEFGIVPEFKAGVHIGLVVAAEVGEIKSEIVFHGDVLNTTARITGLCSELHSDLLISGDLLARLFLPDTLTAHSFGLKLLKGKEHEVEVVAISRIGSDSSDQISAATDSLAVGKK